MGTLHHLSVGCADASIIVASSSAAFLVDCHNIGDHAHLIPGKHLEGVFITHQHRDHFSGLQYLRDNGYTIRFLVYSPYERRYGDSSVELDEWNEFESHREFFVRKGAETRTPFRQESFDRPWWPYDGEVRFEIIGPHKDVAQSPTRELHDACLVVKALLGKRKCLFTGDASDANLAKIAETTQNYCGDILHASHHGSLNGAEESFIKKCNAQYTVISTEPGVYENIPHPSALRLYGTHTSQKVYRTDHSGSIEWTF